MFIFTLPYPLQIILLLLYSTKKKKIGIFLPCISSQQLTQEKTVALLPKKSQLILTLKKIN